MHGLRWVAALALGLAVGACDYTYMVTVTYPREPFPLQVGEAVQLTAVYRRQGLALFDGGVHTVYTAADRPTAFQWSSSVPEVATISADGVLQAHGQGTTTIRATTRGIVSDEVEVPVVSR